MGYNPARASCLVACCDMPNGWVLDRRNYWDSDNDHNRISGFDAGTYAVTLSDAAVAPDAEAALYAPDSKATLYAPDAEAAPDTPDPEASPDAAPVLNRMYGRQPSFRGALRSQSYDSREERNHRGRNRDMQKQVSEEAAQVKSLCR